MFSVLITACQSDPHDSSWFDEETLTICKFLEKNQETYSKSYRLLEEAKMMFPLCGYNPYGTDYTLFLPTNEAIDDFILNNPDYVNLEEMLADTGFIFDLTRYHTLKNKVHTDEFPDGALHDSTLTGERLTFGFYAEGDNQIIKVNNDATIIQSNLDMTNGYIHVISKVLKQTDISGIEWIEQNEDYSILAQALELTRIKQRIWWSKYSILAEHDSVYHRYGIFNIDDLIERIATPGGSFTKNTNPLYKFTGYHIIGNEYYLNDLRWGSKKYTTMGGVKLTIDVGLEIRINPNIDTYGFTISESGDTTQIDYVRLLREKCNINSTSGPIHTISDILFYEPFPQQE